MVICLFFKINLLFFYFQVIIINNKINLFFRLLFCRNEVFFKFYFVFKSFKYLYLVQFFYVLLRYFFKLFLMFYGVFCFLVVSFYIIITVSLILRELLFDNILVKLYVMKFCLVFLVKFSWKVILNFKYFIFKVFKRNLLFFLICLKGQKKLFCCRSFYVFNQISWD